MLLSNLGSTVAPSSSPARMLPLAAFSIVLPGCQLKNPPPPPSFARIHETNLKKQGILPLWFADKADYAKIDAGDKVETVGVASLISGDLSSIITLRVTKADGSVVEIPTKHTMSEDQVAWVKAGSALNLVREVKAAAAQQATSASP